MIGYKSLDQTNYDEEIEKMDEEDEGVIEFICPDCGFPFSECECN